jgi:hypothetical protein
METLDRFRGCLVGQTVWLFSTQLLRALNGEEKGYAVTDKSYRQN